jgi:hypothetical protein
LQTTAGKWWAGVVFLVLAGMMLAPVIDHVLQRLHLEADDEERAGAA